MHKRSHMDDRRLAIFLAVVDEGSFSAAGDALAMSQPAVSQAVRELEVELGTVLFHRLARGVRLSPAGEALVLPARQARRDLQTGRLAVEEVAGLEAGRLDLTCLPTLAVAPLAPLVGAFRAAWPGVTIRLSDPQDTAELLDFVRSGESEVGLVEYLVAEGMRTVSLGTQEFLVVLPPGTEASEPFALLRLGSLPLVATPPGSSTRGLLDGALEKSAATARVVVEVAQREALLPLIVAGAGASLLPAPLAQIAETLGCTVVRPKPRVSRTVVLIHRDGPLTAAARTFIELAVEQKL
ncbi:MAG TPA: LysR substrate-binding domain-containing protein [Acidimicrobiales bacterium]|nr:LysR substrate-binding domain-containing protein [Acidimicrobiales bacterium]